MRAVGSLSLVRNRFDVLTTDERIPMDRRWILSCVCLASAFVGMSCHDDADECDERKRNSQADAVLPKAKGGEQKRANKMR